MKPNTLKGHLYVVKRVHAQRRIVFNTKGAFKAIFDYLCREYELIHGPEALIPRRREGFSREHVLKMLHGLAGLRLRSHRVPVVLGNSWIYWTLKAVIALSAGGGFRLAEVSLGAGVAFNAMHMSRASLFFVIKGSIHRAPSTDILQLMEKGDYVGIIVCPCKNDQFGFFFMPYPLVFPFYPEDPQSTGCILRDYAIHCFIPASELRSSPMFTYGAGLEALRRDFLLMVLAALLQTFLIQSLWALYSWHSFRIGLACALRAANAPDWVILALLRWRSASSIPGYGRINYEASASWLNEANRQHVDSRQTANLPGLPNQAVNSTVASLPNALERVAYEFLSAAQAHASLSTGTLRALAKSLPPTNDDKFISELQRCNPEETTPGEDGDGEASEGDETTENE